MKKLFTIAAAAIMMASCTKTATGYTVSGTAETAQEGDTVFLCSMQGFFQFVPEDTAVVGKDGKFTFKGDIDGAGLRYVVLATEDTARQAQLAEIVLEKANISVKLHAHDSEEQAIVESDGKTYKLYKAFEAMQKQHSTETESYYNILQTSTDSARIAEAEQLLEEAQNKQLAKDIKIILDNAPSAFSDMLFPYFANGMTEEQLDSLSQLMEQSKEKLPNFEAYKQQQQASKATAIGSPYIDLTMPTPEGNEISLSDFVGKSKLVFVDFWASWCGPCLAEMPNVVEAYKKYHDKGLEIVGVSFDNNGDAWKACLERMEMTWPQMSDLKGWESAAAAAYNITGIPSSVLLDEQGNIIAKDLRAEELHKVLEEHLN